MASVRQWWRRAAAALKDRRSLLLARLRPRRGAGSWQLRELEAAVIRATSHEDRWMDYRSAARVFAWARASPSSLRPAMWALARRARRTRCWAVALKSLMVAHGLLLRSGLAPHAARAGRVPFELADFRDRSSALAFSAFVRAYFRFLDYRSLFAAQEEEEDYTGGGECSGDDGYQTAQLDRIAKRQYLLELLLQIRPYGDGMEVPLVLEAMDCALVEVFQVYGEICTGIARFLVSGVPGPAKPPVSKAAAAAGVKVLWRAAEQSARLASYFELCRGLGVVNARRLGPAAFVGLKDDDVRNLERILMVDARDDDAGNDAVAAQGTATAPADVKDAAGPAPAIATVVTTEWVAFDNDDEKPCAAVVSCGGGSKGHAAGNHWNPFVAAPLDVRELGDLIEL
ncbi:unnamed protein product [Urochloa decumbens]|uniref:ENTH domain-containing protein n=1 Tax=Urochloa decumbens TaxID=240449 RepID=A0ABC9FVP4_9POAL